jgi:hypothetical protein
MTTPVSLNFRQEATYGTYVAPNRAFEFDDEDLDFSPNWSDGKGLRVGAFTDLDYRSVETTRQGAGGVTIAAQTKGLGILLDSAHGGTNTSTLVAGTTYQQVFQLGLNPPSLCIQKGIPQTTAGTVDPLSFLGCMVDSWGFDGGNDAVPTFNFKFDIRDIDSLQSFAALTYPTLLPTSIYSFEHASAGYGGTLTAPTTTALASGATAASNLREFKFDVNNNLVRRPNLGLAGLSAKPQVGRREVTGSFTSEYENMTSFLADYRANTSRPLVVTYTSAEALSTGNATLQFVFPTIKLRSAVPQANADETITVEHSFKAYSTATTPALYTVVRTSDTAF